MVSGAMLLSIWAVTSTPSTMYNGDCPLPNVDMPRIQNVAPSATPGSPVDCTEITPAILPAKEVERFDVDARSSLGFTA